MPKKPFEAEQNRFQQQANRRQDRQISRRDFLKLGAKISAVVMGVGGVVAAGETAATFLARRYAEGMTSEQALIDARNRFYAVRQAFFQDTGEEVIELQQVKEMWFVFKEYFEKIIAQAGSTPILPDSNLRIWVGLNPGYFIAQTDEAGNLLYKPEPIDFTDGLVGVHSEINNAQFAPFSHQAVGALLEGLLQLNSRTTEVTLTEIGRKNLIDRLSPAMQDNIIQFFVQKNFQVVDVEKNPVKIYQQPQDLAADLKLVGVYAKNRTRLFLSPADAELSERRKKERHVFNNTEIVIDGSSAFLLKYELRVQTAEEVVIVQVEFEITDNFDDSFGSLSRLTRIYERTGSDRWSVSFGPPARGVGVTIVPVSTLIDPQLEAILGELQKTAGRK